MVNREIQPVDTRHHHRSVKDVTVLMTGVPIVSADLSESKESRYKVATTVCTV